MTVLACCSIKGGVGKTTSAVNLAHLSSREGHTTLLWDLDAQGAASFHFRIEARVAGGARKLVRGAGDLMPHVRGTDFEGLELLPADFSLRHLDLALNHGPHPKQRLRALLEPLEERYTRVFLDCPPGISLVTENVIRAADALLVPTPPSVLSVRTVGQLRGHLGHLPAPGPPLLPFLCMVDRRRKRHRDLAAGGGGEVEFLDAWIPFSAQVESMGERRGPLTAVAPRAAPSLAYERLWAEIKTRLAGTPAGGTS